MTAGRFGRLGVIGAVVAALVGPSAGARSETAEPVAVNAAGQGWPWLSVGDGRPVPMALAGTALPAEALGAPQTLAAGDFDEDGVPDLVSVYAGAGGGRLVLHRGNAESIYPRQRETQAREADGAVPDAPFLAPVRVFAVPEAPHFVATGDFGRSGHLDVVRAAAGSRALHWLRGDGRGGLGLGQRVALPGPVTALLGEDLDRADARAALVVGLVGPDGPQLLVFASPRGALRGVPEAMPLPAPATALAAGDLDGDHLVDLAVAAGAELVLVHGRGRRLLPDDEAQATVPPPRVTRLPLGRTVTGLAVGHFTRSDAAELALLGADGTLSVIAPGATPQPRAPALLAVGPWRVGARLIRASSSTLPLDDLVVVDPAGQQLHVLNQGDAGGRAAAIRVAWDVAGAPVASLPMRLNGDALSDLVVLRAGRSSSVAVVLTDPARVFEVNSTALTGDKDPFDRKCLDEFGKCTLSAALDQVTGLGGLRGQTKIDFEIGTGPRGTSSAAIKAAKRGTSPGPASDSRARTTSCAGTTSASTRREANRGRTAPVSRWGATARSVAFHGTGLPASGT